MFVLPSLRSSRPRQKCLAYTPNSQRHLRTCRSLFIPLRKRTVELPSVSTPYRCFEVAESIEISNTDSTSHDLDLTMSDHRLADRLGGIQRLPLICIFLRASHGLLLLIPRMSDSPYRPRGQPITVFSALHLALRGARMSDSPYQL